MSQRIKKPIELAPPAAVGPLTWREAQEARAVQLALAYAMVVIHTEGFVPGQGPLPDSYDERWSWLRSHLEPLVPYAPMVAAMCRILDPYVVNRSWVDRRQLYGQIRKLNRRTQRLACLLEREHTLQKRPIAKPPAAAAGPKSRSRSRSRAHRVEP